MADGLSIAASVAGLVSLGIQVCSGITTYLDGLKCRAEELEYARRYEQSLKASIQAIGNILSQPTFHHQNSSRDIAACIKPCEDELKALGGLVAELCGEKKDNPSLLDRAKASKKRLTYAFDRPKLSQLQVKVGQAIQSLQLALQILGLESSSSLGHTLQTIEITSNVTAAEIVAARADVTALAGNVSTLRDEAPLIRAAVEKIGPSLLDIGQLATQSVQGMQVMREDVSLANHMLATKMEFVINQLAALQSQSTINQHATTKLLQQQDNRRLFNQMVSRPSYLEEISEECFDISPSVRDPWKAGRARISDLTMTARDGGSSNTVIQSRFGRNCTCRARKRLQRKQVVWSGISFFQDDVYSEKHFPTCQFWQGTRPAERKWGLRQAGLGWLAQKAIEITFSCKYGSGGASFSPNFTYYPTVDEDIAPGFQLVRIMEEAVSDLYHQRYYDVCDYQGLLEKGFEQLEMLFREGRISPNDMNARNQTLIYPLTDLIWKSLLFLGDRSPSKRIILDFVEGITCFEIPSNIYDLHGDSPIENLTAAFRITTIEAVEILCNGFADVPSLSVSQENTFNHFSSIGIILDSIILQMKSPIIAEAYGCGQLSQAVLAGDGKQVERLLQKDCASTAEANCWGQTPLHLSISQPLILQILLQRCGPSQINKLDNHGYTALHYALLSSFKLCRGPYRNRNRCRKCHCARPLKMLLKAGGAVDIGVIRGLDDYDITQRCRSTLIRALKNRRNKLKQLALEKFPDSDFAALNLRSGSVLDTQTATVIRLLEAKRVQIPPALRLTQQHKPATFNGYPGVSVYHTIKCVDDADLFWSHGFRDFDEFNGQFDEVSGDGLPPIATCEDHDLIMWLFKHGANVFRELNPSDGSANRKSLCVRIAHFVYRKTGNRLGWSVPRIDEDFSFSLHAAVLPVNLFDNCECSCSKQGCTPFLMLMKALDDRYRGSKKRCNIDTVNRLLDCLERSLYDFTKKEYKEAIRYFTFTALDLIHTCYHKPWDHTVTCSATIEMCEDTTHIQDEQADTIELLEEILFDLNADLDTMMEDGDHFDIRAFFTDHWLVRVEKELEKISGHELSEDFKKETEAFGVVWDEAAKIRDSDLQLVRDKPLQYWLDAMDRAAQL